jgi:hypothetical protein
MRGVVRVLLCLPFAEIAMISISRLTKQRTRALCWGGSVPNCTTHKSILKPDCWASEPTGAGSAALTAARNGQRRPTFSVGGLTPSTYASREPSSPTKATSERTTGTRDESFKKNYIRQFSHKK